MASRTPQRTGWNLYADDLRKIIPRFAAVRDVVDFMLQDVDGIKTRNSTSTVTWSWPYIKMSQLRTGSGPLEARALFLTESRTTVPTGIIRRIVWNRDRDRQRCKERPVKWPEIAVSHYRLGRRARSLLEKYGENLAAIFTPSVLGTPQTLPHPGKETQESGKPRTNTFVRSVFFKHHYDLQLGWVEAWTPPEPNRMWEELWDAVGAFCQESRRLEGCEDLYSVNPKQYSRLRTIKLK